LYTSTLTFALALITLTTQISKSPEAQNYALSFIFPPYCFATLIADVAKSEYILLAFSFTKKLSVPIAAEGIISKGEAPVFAGYIYFVFFVVQIIVYGTATYGIERGLWGVKREFRPIESTSDIALRFTKLSKTYHSKRAWYWPFKTKTRNLAVDGLDLEVKKGSVTFLLGPNGGGKTTTLKCAAGMHTMDLGSRLEINEAGIVFGICPQQNV
jgi:ABC-type glutathione transport system ATPase component